MIYAERRNCYAPSMGPSLHGCDCVAWILECPCLVSLPQEQHPNEEHGCSAAAAAAVVGGGGGGGGGVGGVGGAVGVGADKLTVCPQQHHASLQAPAAAQNLKEPCGRVP